VRDADGAGRSHRRGLGRPFPALGAQQVRGRAAALALLALAAGACRGPRPRWCPPASARPRPVSPSSRRWWRTPAAEKARSRWRPRCIRTAKWSTARTRTSRCGRHERVRVRIPMHVTADASYRLQVTVRYPVD
jgi:hypothetical protein